MTRAVSGAAEVLRLLDDGTPHVKLVVTIKGIDYGYSGSLSRARHFLDTLANTLRFRALDEPPEAA